MKHISLIFILIFFIVKSQAQVVPWADVPKQKSAVNSDLEDIPIYLVVDSLHRKSTSEETNQTINFFYNANVDLIGYGYKDATGNPYGVWKYYDKKNGKYQLYCEGYYKLLHPENFVVEPDIIKRFPLSNSASVKEDFIQSLSDKLFFTGEWRFYKDDRLEKIIQLDDKVHLPYQLSVSLVTQSTAVQNEQSAHQLNILIPVNRLSGNMAMYVSFSAAGFIESIYSDNIRWKFDPSGKPVIEPLPDF